MKLPKITPRILQLSVALLISAAPALAFIGTGGTKISHNVPCVGLDGAPIAGGAQESMCCRNGALIANAPAQCRAGFNTISGDAVSGAATSITLAQQTLGVASNLNGVNTEFNRVTAPQSGLNNTEPVRAVTSGMVNGGGGVNGDGTDFGSGLTGGDGSGSEQDANSRGGGGSGAGGGGGSGSGSGLMSSSSGGSKNGGGGEDGAADPNADSNKPLGGGFASAGGSGSGRDGGFGSGMIQFGGDGSGNAADGSGNGMDELGFGDEELAEGEAGSEVEGTIHDPANYFQLTNKGDSLFKIVERRYQKKWKKMANTQKRGRIPAAGRLPNNKPI